jgi:hypothetical protein
MIQDFRHELALLAESIDCDGERSDGAADEDLDRFARTDAAARCVPGERRVLISLEWRVHEEFTASRPAIVEQQAREAALAKFVVFFIPESRSPRRT